MDPRWLDLVLALIAAEALGLIAWRLLRGAGPRPLPLIANLGAGAALVWLARDIATQAGSGPAFAALTAAGVAHALDLTTRWERRGAT